jgi:tRNA nucleotidyltransferase/poly(A) polymerase
MGVTMQLFVVGGSVRDVLLNRIPKDLDYVVVGSSHQEMISNQFSKVGASFPIYIHPDTGEEYALARSERKIDIGYYGFDVTTTHVTLQQDLQRRDLTINSMAVSIDDWDAFCVSKDPSFVIDYFGGLTDLTDGILKHTSEAFSEDPIRVLRIARFAARYGFSIDYGTNDLMKKVSHELDAVPAERIWNEFQKGLMEQYPLLMLEALRRCGAFNVQSLRPYSVYSVGMVGTITECDPLFVRFALLAKGFSDADYITCKIPTHLTSISKMVYKLYPYITEFALLSPTQQLNMLIKARSFSNSDTFLNCLTVMNKFGYEQVTQFIINIWHAAKSIDTNSIVTKYQDQPNVIKEVIYEARLDAINNYYN